ncbi:AI-2E family transporter [Candidatus Nomurabacteria bacterium]|nr:AI-2E family transporter [Candidatus Nomurabacteria bacterium]
MKEIKVSFSIPSILQVIGVLVGVVVVWNLRSVLIPLLISIIIAAALNPIVQMMTRRKIPRPLAVLIVFAILMALLITLIGLVIPILASQIGEIVNQGPTIATQFKDLLIEIGLPNSVIQEINIERVGHYASQLEGQISGSVGALVNGLAQFVTIIVFTVYLLLGSSTIGASYDRVVKDWPIRERLVRIGDKISQKLSYWLRGQIVLSFVIFGFSYIGLRIIGVESAFTLAVIAGMTEAIPIIGPVIAGVIAGLVALVTSPVQALLVVLYYIVLQQLENNLIVPLVMRKALGLPPLTVLFALLVGAKLLGFVGVIFAVPLASIITITVEEFLSNGEEAE